MDFKVILSKHKIFSVDKSFIKLNLLETQLSQLAGSSNDPSLRQWRSKLFRSRSTSKKRFALSQE